MFKLLLLLTLVQLVVGLEVSVLERLKDGDSGEAEIATQDEEEGGMEGDVVTGVSSVVISGRGMLVSDEGPENLVNERRFSLLLN